MNGQSCSGRIDSLSQQTVESIFISNHGYEIVGDDWQQQLALINRIAFRSCPRLSIWENDDAKSVRFIARSVLFELVDVMLDIEDMVRSNILTMHYRSTKTAARSTGERQFKLEISKSRSGFQGLLFCFEIKLGEAA
jgi:hypothetical protein